MERRLNRQDVAQLQRIHATRRGIERYGVTFGPRDFICMVGMIKKQMKKIATGCKQEDADSARMSFYQHLKGLASIWRLKYRTRDIVLIFDHKTQCVRTFLPSDTRHVYGTLIDQLYAGHSL